MIPFPEVFAYQEPVDGLVLVATFGGDLRLPGLLDGRRTIVRAVPDERGGASSAAADLAGSIFGEETSAGHDETAEELFDPFAGEPEPPFDGREWVDVETGGRV